MAIERSDATLTHLRTLWSEGALGSLGDGDLLSRFVAQRGDAAEAAFAALVERHAPMVFLVCRQMLCDEHDAQDASQATFLVLANKARTIKNRKHSGAGCTGWLFEFRQRQKWPQRGVGLTSGEVVKWLHDSTVNGHSASPARSCTRRLVGCPSDIACRWCFAISKV